MTPASSIEIAISGHPMPENIVATAQVVAPNRDFSSALPSIAAKTLK